MLRKSPLGRLRSRLLAPRIPRSQNGEADVLDGILSWLEVPRSFVEFGFHPDEFNCARLVDRFDGLLIDGEPEAVGQARRVFGKNITPVCQFLDLGHLDVIRDFCRTRPLGILSIDVDGNDYWFLEALIGLRPAVVIVEYNASLGLRPLSVPYDKMFVRHARHESGWYHGASLTALDQLCGRSGYDLVAVAPGGCNAFFVRADLSAPERRRAPGQVYLENALRNEWSKTTAATQWERIKDLPYVSI